MAQRKRSGALLKVAGIAALVYVGLEFARSKVSGAKSSTSSSTGRVY